MEFRKLPVYPLAYRGLVAGLSSFQLDFATPRPYDMFLVLLPAFRYFLIYVVNQVWLECGPSVRPARIELALCYFRKVVHIPFATDAN